MSLVPPISIQMSKSVMRGFRRRAWKAYPNEHMEMLWGFRVGSVINVVASIGVKQTSTPGACRPDEDEWAMALLEAPEHGLAMVGSIHTHPLEPCDNHLYEFFQHLSMTDHCSGKEWNELISAVTVLYRVNKSRRSTTKWWIPQGKIPVKYT